MELDRAARWKGDGAPSATSAQATVEVVLRLGNCVDGGAPQRTSARHDGHRGEELAGECGEQGDKMTVEGGYASARDRGHDPCGRGHDRWGVTTRKGGRADRRDPSVSGYARVKRLVGSPTRQREPRGMRGHTVASIVRAHLAVMSGKG
jgi:hypothetical protein